MSTFAQFDSGVPAEDTIGFGLKFIAIFYLLSLILVVTCLLWKCIETIFIDRCHHDASMTSASAPMVQDDDNSSSFRWIARKLKTLAVILLRRREHRSASMNLLQEVQEVIVVT